MRKLLSLAIPIVLAVGLMAAFVNDPKSDGELAAPVSQPGEVTDTTVPAVIEIPVESTTTTAAPAPVPETTTTTSAPAPTTTTTTVRRVAAPAPRPVAPATTPTTTAAAPAPTQSQTPAPSTVDCGTGGATAVSNIVAVGPNYQLSALVKNESNKTIELDALVVKATYSGGAREYRVSAGGRQISPGAEVRFDIAESANPEVPSNFDISDFRFHTAGLPECASR